MRRGVIGVIVCVLLLFGCAEAEDPVYIPPGMEEEYNKLKEEMGESFYYPEILDDKSNPIVMNVNGEIPNLKLICRTPERGFIKYVEPTYEIDKSKPGDYLLNYYCETKKGYTTELVKTLKIMDRQVKLNNIQERNQPNAKIGDLFGYSVAMNDDYVMADMSGFNDNDERIFEVHLYKKSDPSYSRVIVPSDFQKGEVFGSSISSDGDFIVIGSTVIDGNTLKEAVYIYKISDESYERKVIPSSIDGVVMVSNPKFVRTSVDVRGDYFVFGGGFNDDKSGAVYLYKFSDENFERRIINPSPKHYDNFGSSVALSDEHLVVGAAGDDEKYESRGSVYVYSIEDELYERRIVASNGEDLDNFGHSVDIEGNDIVVGTNKHFGEQVYIYRIDDELYERIIIPSDFGLNSGFGLDVQIYEDKLVVGAPFAEELSVRPGAVYIYSLTDTDFEKKIPAAEEVSGSYFGYSIAYDGKELVTTQSMSFLKEWEQKNILYIIEIN